MCVLQPMSGSSSPTGLPLLRDSILAWMAAVFAFANLWMPEGFALVSQLRLFHTAFPSAPDEHSACLFLSVLLFLPMAQDRHPGSGPHSGQFFQTC